MGTIIDSLVMELGFDTANVEKGRKQVVDNLTKTKQAAQDTGKAIEDSAQKAGDYLSRLRNNVIGLYAAFTAGRGLKEFLSDMTTSNAAVGRFANTINESVQNIASWRAAGSLLGISAGDIDSTFQNLTTQFEQFRLTGDSTVVPWFRAVGLSMTDIDGKMIPLGDQFLNLADKFSTFKDKAEAATIMQNMGIAPGMIQIILQGRDAVQELLASQKAYADAVAKDAPAAAARLKAWNEFKNIAETIGIKLLTTLTPALITITNIGKAFTAWGERHPELVGIAFSALTGIVLALSTAMTVSLGGIAITTVRTGLMMLINLSKGLALNLAVLTRIIPVLSRAFFTMALAMEATPIGWLVTGIALLSIAGYELYKHWEDIRKWWHWLWNDMGKDTQQGSDKAVDGIDKLKRGAKGGNSKGGKPYKERDADIKTLQNFGWTRDQATGIVANIQAESSGDIKATGDNGNAFGLGQWHKDRQDDFKKWTGHDIQNSTRIEQLAFINYELRNKEQRAGKALASTTNAASAADVVSRKYERPGDVEGQASLRASIAANIPQAQTGVAAGPAPVQSPLRTAVAKAVVPAPAGAGGQLTGASQRAVANDNRSSVVSTSDTRINEMHIHTQATDAKGIAHDARTAFADTNHSVQSNYGPS